MKKIIKAIKIKHCCNGTLVEDEEMGHVLQFQGDQRDNVMKFILENGARSHAAPAAPSGPRLPVRWPACALPSGLALGFFAALPPLPHGPGPAQSLQTRRP